uniref:Tetratricopeptide repeat protein 26 n=1 Tax=Lotharella oceanica TaxID=641309 RepID=A0A7S2TNI4_9EUKA|mmetsp:Transcript_22347/g.41970  ORF Transcript_22347/g.41970 Transcript_22347/m.41970 type:complete len:562 (+) Transcript_22347:92-1777(+)|eukprot:CAMPEP_0170198480 /NCGR_PEP_ID=MMETSP0040_2-20121228/68790_1 /TAXON_ID=641309 /ORGANISM="Lotharella oceanica, Strain CCMP622" /LENGTH=561 /DNA_ID=CAMNT_0010448473 /DNA_START=16 /DNA_END=1701 /DNA_ORIENTATION=-
MFFQAKKKIASKVPLPARNDGDTKGLDIKTFIGKRDYTGAITLLEFERQTKNSRDTKKLELLAYCYFHNCDYQKAVEIYDILLKNDGSDYDPCHHLHKAASLFYLGEYKEAKASALAGPKTRLRNRILLHVSHKLNENSELMKYHQELSEESTEDQLCLASLQFMRTNHQEATEIYKKVLLGHGKEEYVALQVYVALCYYKLDYYDVSLDILDPYLKMDPTSMTAVNLKACNHFKLYDGKAGEGELKVVLDQLGSASDNIMIRHNLVVFRNGENALKVLPPLVDSIPEARLNLVIYHLRNDDVQEAYNLLQPVEPTTPQEYILKGVVNAALGQMTENADMLKLAQQFFQLVGASASECDTIPGRQCMASCFFLLKQFDDVLIYLKSVKPYSYNDPIFNYNFGIAQAACEQYKDAEESLLLVTNERYRSEYTYLSWLARCFIMNGKPRDAWELYLKMESNSLSFNMLLLIANDCYKVGEFYYSAKAFDVLERLDPSPEYWDGKKGACCGVFQKVIAGRAPQSQLSDVIMLLRNNHNSPQAEFMIRVMKDWAHENGVKIMDDE